MAWTQFPALTGQPITAAMVNELYDAIAQRDYAISGTWTEPQRVNIGQRITRGVVLDLQNRVETLIGTASAGDAPDYHWKPGLASRWMIPNYTYPDTPNFQRLTTGATVANSMIYNAFRAILGRDNWEYPAEAMNLYGRRIIPAVFNEIYQMLDALRTCTTAHWSSSLSCSGLRGKNQMIVGPYSDTPAESVSYTNSAGWTEPYPFATDGHFRIMQKLAQPIPCYGSGINQKVDGFKAWTTPKPVDEWEDLTDFSAIDTYSLAGYWGYFYVNDNGDVWYAGMPVDRIFDIRITQSGFTSVADALTSGLQIRDVAVTAGTQIRLDDDAWGLWIIQHAPSLNQDEEYAIYAVSTTDEMANWNTWFPLGDTIYDDWILQESCRVLQDDVFCTYDFSLST